MERNGYLDVTGEQASGVASACWIAAANLRLAGHDWLRWVAGPNGRPLLRIETPVASALVARQGAQILAFRPAGGVPLVTANAANDLLFLSRQSRFTPGCEIMGGVPVCWPWFGRDSLAKRAGLHGFARYCDWSLERAESLNDGSLELVFRLDEAHLHAAVLPAEIDAQWPAGARLALALRIGPTLALRLTTDNDGPHPLRLTQGLHSYFRIADPAAVTVDGLAGCRYLDKSSNGFDALLMQLGPVRLAGEMNRIYREVPGELVVTDDALRRRIRIRGEHSRTCVVWNPGQDIARTMDGLGCEDYRDFVCVETVNTDLEVVEIAPGASACLGVEFAIEPLESSA